MPEQSYVINIKAQLARAQKDINKTTRGLKNMGKQTDKTTKKMKEMSKAGGTLKNVMSGVAILFAGKAFLGIAVTFEKLRVKLETFTGSQREANKVWERLNETAATTQVDVDQLIDSYTQLRSVGIDPTNTEMQRLADLAAATGLQFSQLSNIIFRGTSSTELFYNAGITARVEGEKLRVTYQGVEKVIDKNAVSIKNYLVELTKTQGYVGASKKLAEGIGGAMSNISGNFKALVEQIGRTSGSIQGLADIINKVAGYFADFRKRVAESNSVWFAMDNGMKIATASATAFFSVFLARSVIKGFGSLKTAILRVNAAILANPVVLIGAAITAAIIGVISAMVYFKDSVAKYIGKAVGFIYEKMLNVVSIFDHLMPGALTRLGEAFGKAFDWISKKVGEARDWVVEKLKELKSWFFDTVDDIKEKAKELGDSLSIDIEIPDTLQARFDADAKKAEAFAKNIEGVVKGSLKTVEDFAVKASKVVTDLWTGEAISSDLPEDSDEGSKTQTGPTINDRIRERMEEARRMAADHEAILLEIKNQSLEQLLQAEEDALATRLERIQASREQGKITEAEAYAERISAFQSFQDKKTSIQELAEKKRQDNSVMAGLLDVKTQEQLGKRTVKEKAQQFRKDLDLISQHSRAAFNINKAFRIAEAVQNTHAAFTAALAGPPGPPWSYAFAAAALGAGFAQVASISSQQFNPPRRMGGPVTGGLPGLVGENGPEIFTPKVDGNITPNEADGGPSLGGSTFSGNIYVDARTKPVSETLMELNEENIRANGTGFSTRRQYGV